mgnify:CR=1 FL=1
MPQSPQPISLLWPPETALADRQPRARLSDQTTADLDLERTVTALAGMHAPPWDYLGELIERRRSDPDDGLISALIEVSDADDGRLSPTELHWWCTVLLLAGYETTAHQLLSAVVLLLGTEAAAYPWELLHDQTLGETQPLVTRGGLIRQLVTSEAGRKPIDSFAEAALVVGVRSVIAYPHNKTLLA